MADFDFWTTFRESRNPMVLIGLDRRVIEANGAARAMTHRAENLSAGRPALDFIVPSDHERFERAWSALERDGHVIDEEHVRTMSGATVRFDYAAVRTSLPERADCYLLVAMESAVEPDDSPPAGEGAALSPRETEVVGLVAKGLTTGQIAEELVLSPETIRTHVAHAMEKTGARTRAHLVASVFGRELTT